LNKIFNLQLKNGLPVDTIIANLSKYTTFKVFFDYGDMSSKNHMLGQFASKSRLQEMKNLLDASITEDNLLYMDGFNMVLNIKKNAGILGFTIEPKKLYIVRFDLIIFWNFLAFLAVSVIALVFVKNQIRSINTLKTFVNDFSLLEKENNNFRPSGAKEIREIGRAFLNMINKIKYLLNSRTVMLAQISHDLRTPLTRMKLQTEFIEDKAVANFLKKDLEEMNNFINEYILFARGENQKEYTEINLREFFDDIMMDYKRSGYNNIKISYNLVVPTCFVRKISFRRAINNLLNNSLKYAKNIIILKVETSRQRLFVSIEDDGKGMPAEYFKKLKRPFYTSEKKDDTVSPNGLGLSIVQQTIMGHRGSIKFSNSKKLGGLSVLITMPINNNRKNARINKK
jgi:two-component system osmolarity sensor histidine kinase EnvZ